MLQDEAPLPATQRPGHALERHVAGRTFHRGEGPLAGTGTFTVTGLTATRMQGTLTGTLQRTPPTAATAPIDVNVAFDIGLP